MTDAAYGQLPGWLVPAIAAGASELGLEPDTAALDKLARLLVELQRWNRKVNLTAIRDLREMVAVHLLDSLAARPLISGRTVLDVGTGGGFPGLPLAIVAPGFEITLLDSNGKKIGFVRHMIGELGLGNAHAVKSRAESYSSAEGFDTVIARAFAALPHMLDLTGHLVSRTGMLVALKGKYPAAEIEELRGRHDSWDCKVTELFVPGLTDHERHAVSLTRREGSGS